MCIAIVKPEGVRLTRRTAKNCFSNNDDGAGFAWVEDGKVHVRKGFFSFRKFWKEYRKVNDDFPCLVHFRITTHGATNAMNCHPFELGDGDGALIHNGIINNISVPANKSDTATLVDNYVDPLVLEYGMGVLRQPEIQDMLALLIGSGSKVATLDSAGEFTIVNEEAGMWDDGIWFSNTTYLYSYTSSVTAYGATHGWDDEDDGEWDNYEYYKPSTNDKPYLPAKYRINGSNYSVAPSRSTVMSVCTKEEYEAVMEMEEMLGILLSGMEIHSYGIISDITWATAQARAMKNYASGASHATAELD